MDEVSTTSNSPSSARIVRNHSSSRPLYRKENDRADDCTNAWGDLSTRTNCHWTRNTNLNPSTDGHEIERSYNRYRRSRICTLLYIVEANGLYRSADSIRSQRD